MDTGLEPTIAALHGNVIACRDVADLALLSAEHLEQLAHLLERDAWHARLTAPADDGGPAIELSETERRMLATLVDTCAGWVRLMKVYCGNLEAAFAASPRLAAALPPDVQLCQLARFWEQAEQRFGLTFSKVGRQGEQDAVPAPEAALILAPAAAATGRAMRTPGI